MDVTSWTMSCTRQYFCGWVCVSRIAKTFNLIWKIKQQHLLFWQTFTKLLNFMTKLKKFKTNDNLWDFTRNEELWKWWEGSTTHFMLERFQQNFNMFQRQFIQNWMIGREIWLLVEFPQYQSLVDIQRYLLLLLQLSVDKKTSHSKRIFEFVQFVTVLQWHSQKLKILWFVMLINLVFMWWVMVFVLVVEGIDQFSFWMWVLDFHFLSWLFLCWWFCWSCNKQGKWETKNTFGKLVLAKQNKTKRFFLDRVLFLCLTQFFWLFFCFLLFFVVFVSFWFYFGEMCWWKWGSQAVQFWYWQMIHHSKTCLFDKLVSIFVLSDNKVSVWLWVNLSQTWRTLIGQVLSKMIDCLQFWSFHSIFFIPLVHIPTLTTQNKNNIDTIQQQFKIDHMWGYFCSKKAFHPKNKHERNSNISNKNQRKDKRVYFSCLCYCEKPSCFVLTQKYPHIL